MLLRFAIYLELACESHFYRESPFTFHSRPGDTPKKVKSRASGALKRKVDNPLFKQVFPTTLRFQLSGEKHKAAKVGSHSFRKYAKTRARRSGVCSKDEVDLRGRWKQDNTKPSASYEDTCMPFPDAKVAFVLCHGGPIGYEIVEGSGLSNEWIIQHVTPNTATVYGTKMATILGNALLWACCDEDAKSIVDTTLHKRVMAAYNAVNHAVDDNKNPVHKVGLVLRESNGVSIINTCNFETANQPDNRENTTNNNSRLQMVETMLQAVMQNQTNLQNTMVHEFAENSKLLRKIDRLQKRMAAVPAVRATRKGTEKVTIAQDEDNDDDTVGRNTRTIHVPQDLLSPCPKDLFTLWKEYEFGLGNRKPARLFTTEERGKVSSIFSKRNKVWKLIQDLINKRSEPSNIIIDAIYATYGYESVTNIIKKIQRDEKTGGHPNLR